MHITSWNHYQTGNIQYHK